MSTRRRKGRRSPAEYRARARRASSAPEPSPPAAPAPLRAAIYIRKSREDRDKPAFRLEFQRTQLPEEAEARGWVVVMTEDDGFASAARQATLPGLQRIITAIRARAIDVVLAIELTRFSRDDSAVEFTEFLETCRLHDVKLAIPGALYDPANPNEWLLLMMSGGLSAVEMKVLKTRMAQGRAEARRQGRWGGGRAPVGYKTIEDRKGLFLSDDAPKVAEAIKLSVKHSAAEAAEMTGLSEGTLRRALSSRRLYFYAGLQDDGEGNLVKGQWPAIIEEKLVHKVLAAKQDRNARGGKSTRPVHLLTGLDIFRCGVCGRSVKSWRDGRRSPRTGEPYDRPVYYGCSSRSERGRQCEGRRLVRAMEIERRVLADVERRLADRDTLRKAARAYTPTPLGAPLDLLSEIHELEKQKRRLVHAVSAGALTLDDIRSERTRIENEIARLMDLMHRTEEDPVVPFEEIPAPVDFDELDFEASRRVLVECLELIEVDLPNVNLVYRFPVTAKGERRVVLRNVRQVD